MPTDGSSAMSKFLAKKMQEAKRRVREKYPDLLEGSSGWARAVAYRFHKR